MGEPILSVAGFTKTYGSKVAADGYSLSIEPGQIMGLVGPNGAGKTTLITSIVGIQGFDGGTIAVAGHNVVTEPVAAKARLAYVPDTPAVYGFMTGRGYLDYVCDVFAVPAEERDRRIQELAERLAMTDALGEKASSYSHGMQQKLVLMGAFVHDPELLVLDEPFVGLDPVATRTLRAMLRERADAGGAVLFSSHVLEVVERLCDTVAILMDGSIRAKGPIAQVMGDESLEDAFMAVMAGDGAPDQNGDAASGAARCGDLDPQGTSPHASTTQERIDR